jgi:hypothetical protein
VSKHSIPQQLYQQASKALKDKFHYEHPERYALQCIADSGRRGELVEKIFITTAQAALARHPIGPQRHMNFA